MKKIISVYRRRFADVGNSLCLGFLFCVLLNASILLPCLLNAAALPGQSEIIKGIIELPNIEQSGFPRIGSSNFLVVNIISDKFKAVKESAFSAIMPRMQIQNNCNEASDESAQNTRKDYAEIHPILFSLQFLLGALIGISISFFIFLILIGNLDFIFPKEWLKKIHIPSWLYHDDY